MTPYAVSMVEFVSRIQGSDGPVVEAPPREGQGHGDQGEPPGALQEQDQGHEPHQPGHGLGGPRRDSEIYPRQAERKTIHGRTANADM